MTVRSFAILGVTLAMAGLVSACGWGNDAFQTQPPTTHAERRADTSPVRLYRVVAPVFSWTRNRQELACINVLTSLPPAGCGGVPVKGYDFEHIHGVLHFGESVSRLGNAGWQTPPLNLLGHWNGRVLKVTRVSLAAQPAGSGPVAPSRCDGSRTTRASRQLARALTRVHRRINLLELQACGGAKVWVLVGVADRRTTSYLRRHYGRRVIVDSWLRSA